MCRCMCVCVGVYSTEFSPYCVCVGVCLGVGMFVGVCMCVGVGMCVGVYNTEFSLPCKYVCIEYSVHLDEKENV